MLFRDGSAYFRIVWIVPGQSQYYLGVMFSITHISFEHLTGEFLNGNALLTRETYEYFVGVGANPEAAEILERQTHAAEHALLESWYASGSNRSLSG